MVAKYPFKIFSMYSKGYVTNLNDRYQYKWGKIAVLAFLLRGLRSINYLRDMIQYSKEAVQKQRKKIKNHGKTEYLKRNE